MYTEELFRMLEGLVVIGKIAQTDHANRKLRILHNDDESSEYTGWIPWPADVGRNYIHWKPCRINAQVILLCPSGDLSNAVIVGELYTPADNILPSTQDENIDRIDFNDGTRIEYDSEAHHLIITAVDQTTINTQVFNLNAETANLFIGTTNWQGDTTHGGGNFISNNVSVSEHNHKENGAGSNTDNPNPIVS